MMLSILANVAPECAQSTVTWAQAFMVVGIAAALAYAVAAFFRALS